MEVFKPITRKFVAKKAATTLVLPSDDKDAPPPFVDSEVVEFQGDDGWKQWQDSVFVEEFTDEAMQTVPGELK